MDNIVRQLIDEVHSTGNKVVVMDNRFTSIYVAETLSQKYNGIGIVGVIKTSRKCLPKTESV